jgi:hypothetical protein
MTTSKDKDTAPRIGQRRYGYTMQPLDWHGRYINGGNHYANADTIEAARAYAHGAITHGVMGYTVCGVDIDGTLWEFAGSVGWEPVTGRDARHSHERVLRDPTHLPARLTGPDLRQHCYQTTVRNYLETVHEQRSDGSCQCGHYRPGIYPLPR